MQWTHKISISLRILNVINSITSLGYSSTLENSGKCKIKRKTFHRSSNTSIHSKTNLCIVFVDNNEIDISNAPSCNKHLLSTVIDCITHELKNTVSYENNRVNKIETK